MILRAVTYNRCSTEEESQVDALKMQVQESKSCIKEMGWLLVDTYVESKSGTSTKGREEYLRLYDDLATDKFDIIVIKSQDRLMRNVKDWYLFLDRMLANEKRLYIYIEQKFYTPDDALITGIKAILAEDYSRELSKKINNAHRSRQKNGRTFVITSRTFGYQKRADKSIVVDEEEAEVVRKMYEYSAIGYGSRSISNLLYEDGCCNREGKRFTEATIRRIIRSKLPMGTVVMNKKHFDFDTKKTVNLPESKHIIIPDAVPAIIDEGLWRRANEAMDKRAETEKCNGRYVKGSNPGKYPLSGKIVCGECGAGYYRGFRRPYKGREICDWRCSTYINQGRKDKKPSRNQSRKVKSAQTKGCDNIHLEESKLFALLEQVCLTHYANYNKIDTSGVLERTIKILRQVLSEDNVLIKKGQLQEKKEKVMKQRDILLEKLLSGVIRDEDYQRKIQRLDSEMDLLAGEIQAIEIKQRESTDIEGRLIKIKDKLEKEGMKKATVYEMLQNIEQITVYPEYMVIHFSSSKLLGLKEKNQILENILSQGDGTDSLFDVEVSLIEDFRKDIVLERTRDTVISCIDENPKITGRILAERLGVSLSTANKRLSELKKSGRIRFIGAGGHGHWEVMEKSNSSE